jgi:hypothetical protein
MDPRLINGAKRTAAKAAGLKHFFTNKACKRGHISLRLVSTGDCVACTKWRQQTPDEKARRRTPDYRAAQRAHKQRPEIRMRQQEREQTPEVQAKRWARRGYPMPTRPRPKLCEAPGCIRKACCLDHDHVTGKFRGWLCHPHNAGIGLLGDTLNALEEVVRYLKGTA